MGFLGNNKPEIGRAIITIAFVLIIFIQTYTYIGDTINHNDDYRELIGERRKEGIVKNRKKKMLVNMLLSFRGGGIQGKICLLPLCVEKNKLINAEQKVGNIYLNSNEHNT